MKDKVLYAVFVTIYLLILGGYAAVYMMTDDPDALAMAGAAVSSSLMLVTLIIAVVLLKGDNSERYKEMFIDGKEEGSDKPKE